MYAHICDQIQELIDVAVILNALRALRIEPG